jgi:hypothetical protein
MDIHITQKAGQAVGREPNPKVCPSHETSKTLTLIEAALPWLLLPRPVPLTARAVQGMDTWNRTGKHEVKPHSTHISLWDILTITCKRLTLLCRAVDHLSGSSELDLPRWCGNQSYSHLSPFLLRPFPCTHLQACPS